MVRVGLALLVVSAAAAVAAWVTTEPSAAEIEGVQRTSWGLASPAPARTVDRFDALGWAVEEIDGVVFAGGRFQEVTNGTDTGSQAFLAAFAMSTGAWLPDFAPMVGGPVLALERAPDGGLFVGGEIDDWNGQEIGALAKIDPQTGEMWPGWNTRVYGGSSVVRDLSLGPDGWLYVAGTFDTASDGNNPQPVDGVVRIDPDTGNIDWSWIPTTDGGSVWGVAASYTQSTVYLAGWNNVKNGQQVIGISATDPDQVTWDSFVINFPCCDHMYDVQPTPYGTVMVVGEQHGAYVYDENNGMALMISHATSWDSRYQDDGTRRGGDFQDIELVGDRLYATCHCWGSHSSLSGPSPLPYTSNLANSTGTHTGLVSAVIAYDAQTGARDEAFSPYMSGDIGGWGVLSASDGCLWIAGGINAVGQPGSQAPGRDLVRLCDENGPTPPPVPAPETCLATIAGDTVTVTWDTVDVAVDYVIYRTVDGGNQSWRGRTTAAPFIDTNRDAELAYFVAARDVGELKSDRTPCTSDVIVDPPQIVDPPTNCVATITGDTVDVAWDAVNDAAEYVIYRSVDGGTQFWRGRTTDTAFTDSNRDAQLTYYVAAKRADGERSDRAPCQTVDETPPPEPVAIDPVGSCTATIDPADPTRAIVTWDDVGPQGADAIDPLYVIRRTVDGGTQFWRGRTADTTFIDDLRAGEIVYFVEVKAGNDRSTLTTCQPSIQGAG
ncbi:MAG: hypothetical protein ACR2QO_13865 [Acidimicrobiales bacterium]